MRRGYILLIISLLTIFTAYGQKLNPDYYTYPLKNVAGYYSANFGEMRPNHFHSGTDFKTDGVTEATLLDAVERYRLQVQTYGEALSRIYEMPIKARYLYFFRLNRFVEV